MRPARDSSPRGSSLGRFLNRGQWTILLALYAAIIFAAVVSVDYRNTSPGHSLAAWAVTWVRIYAFHIGLLCGLVAALALVTLKLGRFFCALPLLLFCLQQELGDYREKTIPTAAGETMTAMTWCLDWGGPADAATVLSEVQQADPDVLLLQRFTKGWNDALHQALVLKYPHNLRIVRDADHLGTAIYSRRPFEPGQEEGSRIVSLGDKQVRQVRAVLRIDGQSVAVYCLRLLPLQLNETTTHRLQFADLKQYLEQEKLPAIVAGDLGFTRRTRQGNDLRDLGFEDAHQWVGKGRGGTWPANRKTSWLPLMQLDHIYLSRGLVCTECRTGEAAGSDHLPVIARIGLSPADGDRKQETDTAEKATAASPTGLPKTDLSEAALPSTFPARSTRTKTLPDGELPRSALPSSAVPEVAVSVTTSRAIEHVEPVTGDGPQRADGPPPQRDPLTAADDPLPPGWEPWSRENEPPRRSPAASHGPPLRAPGGSR